MAGVDLKTSQIAVPDAVKAAIADVRADTSPNDWCLCRLEGDGTLQVVGCGDKGVAELATQLSAETAYYGLVRTTEAIDSKIAGQKDAVKFCFITFLGEDLGPMRKGKITTYKGTVTQAFEPFHCELMNATSPDEVTASAINELLSSMFGTATANRSLDDGSMRIGQRTIKMNEAGKQRTGLQSAAVTCKQEVGIPRELVDAIADVRADASPTNWCLCRLEGAALQVVGSGSGGVPELAVQLSAEYAYYGLVRTSEAIDSKIAGQKEAVKFAFITFLGESLSVLKKGKIATLKGTITQTFEPFHIELMNATSPSEVTLEAILELLSSLFGKASDVIDTGSIRVGQKTIKVEQHTAGANGQATDRRGSTTPRPPGATGGVGGGGETPRAAAEALPAEVAAAIGKVRSDTDPVAWCCVGYNTDAKAPLLRVVAVGEGKAEAVQGHLEKGELLYVLIRLTQLIDKSLTTKFVLVSWVGEEVAPMRKARLSTLRGSATSALGPFHAELLNPSEASSVTHEALMGLLQPVAVQ